MDREKYNKYHREYERKRHEKRKKIALKFLGGECVECGIKNDLQFDHIDPKKKTFHMNHALRFSEKRMMKELKKCQLLCGNCHRFKSVKDTGNKNVKDKNGKVLIHGTVRSYQLCRCSICIKAHNTRCREYRKLNREKIIKQKKSKYFCLDCGKNINPKSTRCRKCHLNSLQA